MVRNSPSLNGRSCWPETSTKCKRRRIEGGRREGGGEGGREGEREGERGEEGWSNSPLPLALQSPAVPHTSVQEGEDCPESNR